jgi:hypothetical protein
MTNESARAYIALAVEVEEVRQEVASVQARLASDPSDREATQELKQSRELLERLEFAAGVFMRLLKERNASVERNLYQSAEAV